MRPNYPVSPFDGVRNLCLGRVLLKENAAATDTEIKVGTEFAAPDWGCSIIGSHLWYNNALDDGSGTAVIVQPAAADAPGDIEHQETVAIDQTELGTKNLHLHITDVGGLANAYTTARGAYVRLTTLPSVCSGLQVVQQDFTAELVEPQDKWFPAVYVLGRRSRRESLTNTQWIDTFDIIVRYGVIMDEGYRRQDLHDELEDLAWLFAEDFTLGGTCYLAFVPFPAQFPSVPGRITVGGSRDVLTAQNMRIDWGDVYIWAQRLAVTDKTPTPP